MLRFSAKRAAPASLRVSQQIPRRKSSFASTLDETQWKSHAVSAELTTIQAREKPYKPPTTVPTRTGFSYGAMVAEASMQGRPLTRAERQAAIRSLGRAHTQRMSDLAEQRHNSTSSWSVAPNAHHNYVQAVVDRLAPYSADSMQHGTRNRMQRVSRVQKFFDSVHTHPLHPLGAEKMDTSHKSFTNTPSLSAQKPGQTWSNYAGRPTFSYGKWIESAPPTQVTSPVTRRHALQTFLDQVSS